MTSSGGKVQLPPSVVSDASGVNAPLVDGAGNKLVNVPAWQPNTAYPAGYCVVQGGIIYTANALFTSGAVFNAANWTALTAAGVELQYAEITSNPTAMTTATADIAGLSITFTAPARPVEVEFWCRTIIQNTGAGIPAVVITDAAAATTYVRGDAGTIAAGAESGTVIAKRRISTLTPGASVTLKARSFTSASTANIQAGANFPTYLRAIQL